ncbi:hypothetical protein LWI29_026557 [Acer saccharum]|uniref:EF-hand domain-containing protein n=1 Tax=Acer saccharum TaxID=4024 RepID=A0AA39VK08_ACESA|nr:hypothetical protein LWI29_026557 [Acer saccharum]KAK1559733.1 hypothetical protein Q3G72_017819 [Acer saccharum]
MSKVSFLDFQYKISKSRISKKPSRMFSSDRQNSPLMATYQPTTNEMKQVFDRFDNDKDGKISQSDYKGILTALGQEDMNGEVTKIFGVADLNGDDFIDFKEFTEVHKMGGVRTRDIKNAFRMFDKNRDGKISAEDILEILQRLGEGCSLQDCRQMVRAVDTDCDGMVDMDDFMAMMNRSIKLG